MPPPYWQVYCSLLPAIAFHCNVTRDVANFVLLYFISYAFHVATLTFSLFLIPRARNHNAPIFIRCH